MDSARHRPDQRVRPGLPGRAGSPEPGAGARRGRRAVRADPPRARKKKSDAVEVVRARCAVALSCFYGRAACELTYDAVLEWGIVAGELPTVEQSKAGGAAAPPSGTIRFVNSAHDPRAT